MSSLPTTIGKYQIIREIARSNDIVYEAYDPLMDRRVALKELNLPAGATEQQRADRIARFERECRAVGRLAHPNVMTVYEFGQDGARTFMAMEYLDGNTLRSEIDTRGALPFDRAIEITKSILNGLDHAHSNGVVHRDIKPDNIQLTTNGVKITDFGIARLTFQPNLTMDGQVFGTPSYMSPEQVRGGDIDARSDLFSVGILLYEMLSGTKPFVGDSVITITYAILNKEPAPIDNVGPAVWAFLQRALDKSPGLRFLSAKEMVQALDDAVAQQVSGVVPLGMPTVMPGMGVPIPTGNPYTTPYGTPVPPPPIQYPYNPMTQGPHQTGPVPPGFQLPGNLPIYYPRPPRKPMLTPDQAAAMRRLGAIVLVLGTFFATVIMAILYFTGALGQVSQSPVTPSGSAISPPPAGVDDAPPYLRNAGETLAFVDELLTQARGATSFREKDQFNARAAMLLESAIKREPEGDQRRSLQVEALKVYYEMYLLRKGATVPRQELREPLYGIKRCASPGSDWATYADRELEGLS